MEMYTKIINQKELYEEKFMQTIKEKQEAEVFHKIHLDNLHKKFQDETASTQAAHNSEKEALKRKI